MDPAPAPGPPLRVALVSGAAGGLGQALVRELAHQGWHVAAGQHRHAAPCPPGPVLPLPLDVTSAESCQDAVRAVVTHWGRLDLLVNNAGAIADGPVATLSEADWDRVLAVNLKGAALCARAALPVMVRQRGGHLVQISSYAGRCGARGQANYAAAKAGLLALTQSLAREVGSRNVRVNAVLPGVLPTGMTASLPPATLQAFAAANVLGRINRLDEVARFVAFLASTENISGQVFQLDSRIAPWT